LAQRPLVPLLLLGPPFFQIILFGMTGISLHTQWPLTFQSHGSVSQRGRGSVAYCHCSCHNRGFDSHRGVRFQALQLFVIKIIKMLLRIFASSFAW
jgi:hypothetical protein